MKKTVLALSLAISSTSTFAADHYFTIGAGQGEYSETVADYSSSAEESKPFVFNVNYMNHFLNMGEKFKAGFSVGGLLSGYKGESKGSYANINYSVGTATIYFAPTISFKPIEDINLYAKAGLQYTAMTVESAYSTQYSSGKTSTNDSGFGYVYGVGFNYNVWKRLVVGIEYNITSTNVVDGSRFNQLSAFLNIGFKK